MNRAEFERLLKQAQGSVAGRTEEVVSFDGAASRDGVLGGREEATLTDADGTSRLLRLTSIRLDDAGRVVGPESFAGKCRCGSLLSAASAAFCAGCKAVLCHGCAWGLADGLFCASCWWAAGLKWLVLGQRPTGSEGPAGPPTRRR